MVRPKVSVCNQRHINILHATAISQLFQGKDIDTLQFRNSEEKEAVFYMFNLLRSLNNLKKALVPPTREEHTKGKVSLKPYSNKYMNDVSVNADEADSRGRSSEDTRGPAYHEGVDSRGSSYEDSTGSSYEENYR